MKKISEWAENYDTNLREGIFTCFFCGERQGVKEMLSLQLEVKEQTIMGCAACIKLAGEKIFATTSKY